MNTIMDSSVGKIAITDIGVGEITMLFIHGNSSSKIVFDKQLQSQLTERHRLVAIDLPGHGDSANANNPESDYTIAGYAKLLTEVTQHLELTNVVLVGWSLGGHIAIEAVAQGLPAIGMVLSGTPPVGPGFELMAEAFNMAAMGNTSKADFSEQDVNDFANATIGGATLVTEELRQAVARTDGISREIMLQTSADPNSAHDQRQLVEQWQHPIAVFQGADDVFIQSQYLDGLNWKNLWHGKVQYFDNCGHAPFWQDSEQFNDLLQDFLQDL